MFSRRERLSREQFPAALRAGRRLSSPNFIIVLPGEAHGYAVVIPKKVIRLSSGRHRLKRQVLEVLRTLPLPPSLIVFPRSTASSVRYQDLKAELIDLISSVKK